MKVLVAVKPVIVANAKVRVKAKQIEREMANIKTIMNLFY